MSAAAITLRDVSKLYRRYAYRRQFSTLKSALLRGSLAAELQPGDVRRAVDGVSLAVPAGVTLGLVGRNGSGKSTLLKLVAGITRPTTGAVEVRGRISALIELGAGFHPEISGRENIFINGVMLGLTKREIERRFDEIVEFAEMEDFIDSPVKTYSSGMYMRLGFAVAVHVDPDVLLVDEVLAVGDEGFSLKCLDKFAEFRRRGKTILLVTHGLGLVERYCDQAVWIDAGRVRGEGDPRRVVHAYTTDVARTEDRALASTDRRAQTAAGGGAAAPDGVGSVRAAGPGGRAAASGAGRAGRAASAAADDGAVANAGVAANAGAGADAGANDGVDRAAADDGSPPDMFRAAEGRWGDGPVRIDRVTMEHAGAQDHVLGSGDALTIRLAVSTPEPVSDFVFGVSIFDADGTCCYGTNTEIEEFTPVALSGAGEVVFAIDRLDLVAGTYKLDVAAHTRRGVPYDYHRLLYTFRVKSRTRDAGIYRPRHRWTFSPNVRLRPGTAPPPTRDRAPDPCP